jgi:hypothetical protein
MQDTAITKEWKDEVLATVTIERRRFLSREADLKYISGSSASNYIPLAAIAAPGSVVLTAGAWYARRRSLR